ncbi:MAG: hypothetical protein E6J85_07605 [Deltaproteobacteria bacterium]|nr:MAG: hypothetical protein E6J85_07605 [Deltaproteobacteria bacterium]
MRIVVGMGVLAVLAACGGGNANEVNGSYRGQSISVSDGLLLPTQRDLLGGSVSVVALESAPGACSLLQRSSINNTRIVTIALGIETVDGLLPPATATGTYAIGGPPFVTPGTKLAGVRFGIIGACGRGNTADALSGSVQIDRAIANTAGTVTHLEGTFQAVFDNAESLSGAFQVGLCPGARLAFGLCR